MIRPGKKEKKESVQEPVPQEKPDEVTEIQGAKAVPEIKGDQDAPFPINALQDPQAVEPIDKNLSQTDSLDTEITRFRYKTGREVLYISMGVMCAMVIIDLAAIALGIENNLISSAFEAFKLITMTVLGYIFGSSGSKLS